MRLTDQLVADKILSPNAVEEALENQVLYGGRLGTNLLELGHLTEEQLAAALGRQHGLASACGDILPDPAALALLPAAFCDDKDLLPLKADQTKLWLLVINPNDIASIDEAAQRSGRRVIPTVVPEFRMAQLLRRHCKAFRPLRAIDMDDAAVARKKAQSQARDGAAKELMSEDEFQSLYHSAMSGQANPAAAVALPELPLDAFQAEEAAPQAVAVPMAPPLTEARPTVPPLVLAPVAGIPPVQAPPERRQSERRGFLTPPDAVEVDQRVLPDRRGAAEAQVAPISFQDAQAALAKIADRDDIARTVMRFAAGKFVRALLLRVQKDLAVGWEGVGKGIAGRDARRVAVSLRGDSAFKLVRDSRSHFLGPLKRDAAVVNFIKLIGGGMPKSAVLMPILARGRVVNILYGDGGPDGFASPDIGELLILSQRVGRSYEELIAKRKKTLTAALPAMALALLLAWPAAASPDLSQMVHEHTLGNGMKWLVVKREGAPVFSAYLRVKAGGAQELPGKTGIAHLFEHLAFKGTAVVGTTDFEREKPLLAQIAEVGAALTAEQIKRKPDPTKVSSLKAQLDALEQQHRKLLVPDAFSEIYARNGASGLNATTDKDLTSYFVSLPKNRLELWATMEAARFAAPVLRDFYSEREVVKEERAMRVESEPSGALFEELMGVAFSASPYRWPTVGTGEDLRGLTLKDAMEFYRAQYVPANAVGAVVGDLEVDAVYALLDRTFGAIPASPPPDRAPAVEPTQAAERRSDLAFDAAPRVLVGYHKPTLPDDDDYVFDVLQIVLSDGRTSRLYKSLVTEKKLCVAAFATTAPGARLPNLFVVGAIPIQGKSKVEVEEALAVELEKLKTTPLSEQELQKVRNRLNADLARSLQTNGGLASSLSYFEAVAGTWRYLAEHEKHVAALTAADVMRVAKTYFVPSNRTTAWIDRSIKQ